MTAKNIYDSCGPVRDHCSSGNIYTTKDPLNDVYINMKHIKNVSNNMDVIKSNAQKDVSTKKEVEQTKYEKDVLYVRTAGYSVVGDGGAALYKRVDEEPTHAGKVMSADGAWWELAENIVSAYMFGAREDGSGEDNYIALQSLFDYAVTHPIEKVVVSGNFDISSGLLIKGQVSNCRTFEFSVKLVATSPIDTILTVEDCGRGFQFPGTIELVGQGGASVSSRTCGTGLVIRNSARAIFGLVKASHLIDWGVWMHGDVSTGMGNNNLVNIRGVSASLCGSENTYAHTAIYSGPVNSGNANSVFQRTKINVSDMPPVGDRIRSACFVDIGGDVYFVDGFDDVNKTISIHPWIDPAVGPTGTLKYIYGGACGTLGGDNGVCVFDFIDGGHCGIVYLAGTAYGNDIAQLTAQHSALGVVLGRGLQRTHYSTTINNFYSEALTYDILKLSVETHRVNISGLHETSLSRMRSYRRPRDANGIIPVQSFEGVTLTTDGFNEFFSLGNGLEELSSSKTLGHEQTHVYRMNSWTFNLSLDEAKNSLFGGDGAVLWIFGTGVNNRPTGTFTFNPPAGWTVEGGSTYSLSGFTSQICIVVKWDFRNKNIRVILMKGRDGSNYSTSISTAPIYIGQIAIVSGVAYIATSLNISGWKAITS